MTRRPFAVLALAALAGACHAPPQQPAANTTTSAAATPADAFAEKVAALPDAQRQGVFMRAITDAGFLCQKIETQTQHAPIDGHPAWSIGCDHGNNYVALAMPGDTLQIVPGTTTAPAAQ